MNTAGSRLAGGVMLIALGVGAGAWLHSSHHPAVRGNRGVAVSVGEASAPTPSDVAQDTAAGMTPGAMSPSKIPDRLPQFSLTDRAGKLTSIADFGGKSLVINFWATWCAPCRSEIPLLRTLDADWAGRDVSVVGIAVDTRDKVLEFADRFKIGYPLLIGEQDALEAAAAFGVAEPVFPFTVFTDRRGEIVALFVGELHRPQADLILSVVQDLNRNLVGLPQARLHIVQGLSALKAKTAG